MNASKFRFLHLLSLRALFCEEAVRLLLGRNERGRGCGTHGHKLSQRLVSRQQAVEAGQDFGQVCAVVVYAAVFPSLDCLAR